MVVQGFTRDAVAELQFGDNGCVVVEFLALQLNVVLA
jgi:hypothetical protein